MVSTIKYVGLLVTETRPPGFDWDSNKRERNLKKHGVDFFDAATVFDDVQTRICIDRVDPNTGEDRLHAIGETTDGDLLIVSFADRQDELTWIIAARKVEKHEREAYEEDPWP